MSARSRPVWVFLVIVVGCGGAAGAQSLAAPKGEIPACRGITSFEDSSVADHTIAFATRLSDQGPRPAASDGEARARAAVIAELEAIGLEVTIEPFDYRTFVVEKTTLDLGGVSADPVIVGLDPFANELSFSGEAVVVTDPAQGGQSLQGRIVVTNHPLMQLMISEFEPAVVVTVEPDDLEAFVARGDLDVTLEVEGRPLVLQSANVIAQFRRHKSTDPRILVTSHLDAYQESPGANDNGTGLGLMIEIARTFSKSAENLDVPTTFVAFGAEENGSIGSRAYVQEHVAELADVLAVINLDTLGGALGPVIATKPSQGAGPTVTPGNHVPEGLRGCAWEGPRGRWRIIHPEILPTIFTSNYPEWLHEIVNTSATGLGIEVVHLDLISDHRTFARAGVPALSIQSKQHHIHSKQDTADVLVAETIDSGAKLAIDILCRLQDRPHRPLGPE